jgi:hypothetical protein
MINTESSSAQDLKQKNIEMDLILIFFASPKKETKNASLESSAVNYVFVV